MKKRKIIKKKGGKPDVTKVDISADMNLPKMLIPQGEDAYD